MNIKPMSLEDMTKQLKESLEPDLTKGAGQCTPMDMNIILSIKHLPEPIERISSDPIQM